MKKTKAKTKFYEVEGKRVSLPKGVSVEMKNGIRKVTVTWSEHGKVRRKYFDYSLEGVEQAKDINATKKQELKRFGQEFGTISDDEKQALDLWRAYVKEAMANGFKFSSAYEVMKRGIDGLNTTTPDFHTLARLYFEKELMRKTDGEMTEHTETVRQRLFNIIAPVFGCRPAHTISENDVLDFLDGLKGQNGRKASLVTRTQYLNLLKSVFKFAVEQGNITKEFNPVANLKPAKKRKDAEPEILTVDEVKTIFSFVKNNPKFHQFIPVLAVGFFCGARVEERAKLTYGDIYIGGRNEIFVSAAVAKNGIARFIYPTENVKAWMDFAKAHGVSMNAADTLIQGETLKQRKTAHSSFLRALASETGIVLPKNCIRHTAASFMAESQGYTETANQLGHDIGMLLKHYRRAITKTEAEAFYNITPDAV